MKKKKVTQEQWETAIRKARQYTNNYAKVRWIVASLALEVCDVSKGGRKTESVFSVSRFAKEIEIDRKTLYQWIRVKRLVLDKLPKTVQSKAHTYLYSDFEAVSVKVEMTTDPREVKRAWEEQLQTPPESRKFEKYIRHLDAIFYNVSRPMIMKDVALVHIETVIEKANVIVALAKKELEFRERYPNKKREMAARMGLSGEVAKRVTEASGG